MAATCSQGAMLIQEIDATTDVTDASTDVTDAQAQLENGSNAALYPRTSTRHFDPKENGCLCFVIEGDYGWFVSVEEDGECGQNAEPVKTDYKEIFSLMAASDSATAAPSAPYWMNFLQWIYYLIDLNANVQDVDSQAPLCINDNG